MKKQPLFYDPNRPYAHYAAAGKLQKEAAASITLGKILPLIALPAGIAAVVSTPFHMALFALFGILFTFLGIFGCSVRRAGYTMAGIPLAFLAALTAFLAGSFFSPIAAVCYIIAGLSQCKALWAISVLNELKELPGFPFFDPVMDGISFAAVEYHGGDEYIGDEPEEENTERVKLVPIEPPSEDMEEILTAESVPEVGETDAETPSEPSRYEQMINAQTEEREDMSDIDLFG
ncbi:MAG: hypothetical protein NC253_09080 [Ruminococcus sp.]|nr:hypothetical protein [Ruminococcus sp.]MCM1478381.1 hypothetical protein [Muribaculaceae bacterium]